MSAQANTTITQAIDASKVASATTVTAPIMHTGDEVVTTNNTIDEEVTTEAIQTSKEVMTTNTTNEDRASSIFGTNRRRTALITHAIEEVKTTEIQELMDQIKSLIERATLGYALMMVMDDNEMGRGPAMIRQQVNLRNVDTTFMKTFVEGIHQQGLQNKYLGNAIDLGVHQRDIDLGSLREANTLVYSNHVKWNACAKVSDSVLYNGNHRITYMREYSDYRRAYQQYLNAMEELKRSTSGAQSTAFREAIKKAEGVTFEGGVWLAMICVITDFTTILDFLCMPVKFQDVTREITGLAAIRDAFYAEYRLMDPPQSIPSKVYGLLDTCYFKAWTDAYVTHFQDKLWGSIPMIELFASLHRKERTDYMTCLSGYYDDLIAHAEKVRQEVLVDSSESLQDLVKQAMPAKLKALKYGLMRLVHPGTPMHHYPVPNKLVLYSLSQQLKSIEQVITEVVSWIEPLSTIGIDQKPQIWKDHLRAMESHIISKLGAKDIKAVKWSTLKEELVENDTSSFVFFAIDNLRYTSFPWLDASNVKKMETFIKKMTILYQKTKARKELLATEEAWQFRIKLQEKLTSYLEKKDHSQSWQWCDDIDTRPTIPRDECIDIIHGASDLENETMGNTAARIAGYLELRRQNHVKMQRISKLVMSENLGLGLGDMAIPAVQESLDQLLEVLMVHSEVAVKRMQCPSEIVDLEEMADRDHLEALYPLDLPETMSARDTDLFYGEQSKATIARLSCRPTYKDDAGLLWKSEMKSKQIQKDKEDAQRKTDKKIRSVRVVQLEEKAKRLDKKSKMKSKEIIEGEDENEDKEDSGLKDVPMAGPSKIIEPESFVRNAKRQLEVNEDDQRSQRRRTEENSDVSGVERARSVKRDKGKANAVLKTVIDAITAMTTIPKASEIDTLVQHFKQISGLVKYFKRAEKLMEEKAGETM
ncbi:hypothetical protein ID866_8573, partial [Astraeus odoratus]